METTASVRGVRLSAQKGRIVADLIRGKPVDKALNILAFTPKKAAGIIRKALESAIADSSTTTAPISTNCGSPGSSSSVARRCAASRRAPRDEARA